MRLIAIDRITRGLAAAPRRCNAWRSRRHIAKALAQERSDFSALEYESAPPPTYAKLVEARDIAGFAAERAMTAIAVERPAFQETPAGQSNICRFVAWAKKAEPEERVQAAGALARAYLGSSPMPQIRGAAPSGPGARLANLRRDAELCLTTMLEDRSILVRRALAEALAHAQDAPRHIISALANDESEIARIVVARSPLLDDSELVECATVGDESVQVALARRPGLSEKVAVSLAEADRREVVMALLGNAEARLTADALRRLADRFGDDAEIRELLLERPELTAVLRYDLLAAATRFLSTISELEFGQSRAERARRDTLERCAILVARPCQALELADLMRHLRASGDLTVSLLVRALIAGGRDFFVAAAAELSGVSQYRIAGFVREPHGSGFAALYRRTGLPQQFLTPFRLALATLEELGTQEADRASGPIISRLISACGSEGAADFSDLMPLLRRFETEAALREARALAATSAAGLDADDAFMSPMAAIEPGVGKLLLLLRGLEADSALAELETAPSFFEGSPEFVAGESLAA
jgi:uncharacterized protein (DUF2336 family)